MTNYFMGGQMGGGQQGNVDTDEKMKQNDNARREQSGTERQQDHQEQTGRQTSSDDSKSYSP